MDAFQYDNIIHWGIAALILIAGVVAIKVLMSIVTKALMKSPLDAALYKFICNGLKTILWIVLLGTLLSWLGVPISTFVAIVGVAGAAVALALKDSLGNVVGGFIILLSKPFRKGDFIEVNNVTGKADQIDLLFTTMRTVDNKIVYLPNGLLSTSVIVNSTLAQNRRVDCRFSISYDSEIDKAKEILSVIAEQNELIRSNPEPIIGVADLLNGCINIDMKVWCETDHYWTVKYFLEENVKIAFDEAGIEIAHSPMDVYIKVTNGRN